ncbi:tail fiber assembly protein [Novosphingobium sp. PY1]|uniref:tail fiber assembly protein n=1 Tax=Novosphingobium sp. PY1 TaxID=1882221 RepID=UPI001A8DB175|nr:tail fiber assembly protein [Novosphingobium sp. PY1]GFM28146.1 putative phage tail fibre protein [Novosphingobium sp. PY1]
MARYFSSQSCGFYDSDLHLVVPADAVEITPERHAELLQAQAEGMVIKADEAGEPLAVIPAPPSEAEQWRALRKRRGFLLTASDWTQMPDSPLTDALRSDWAAYRQALRDLPETVTDPATAEWPVAPA